MPNCFRRVLRLNAHRHVPLFRPEVAKARKQRLHGDVSLAVPVSWQVIGFTLLAALIVALVFLATASYARTETVGGAIVLDRGVAQIIPSRAGIVADLPAREGQRVSVGDPLISIRSEEDMASGPTVPRRILDSLRDQDARLASQTSLVLNAAAAERSRLAAQIEGARQEIASLNSQIDSQQRLIEVATSDFRDVQSIAEKGFISRRDVDARENTLISRRQQLAQFEQLRASKRAQLAETSRSIEQVTATAEAQAAGVQSNRAGVVQRLAEVESSQGYTITSPVSGTVTALTARLGQAAVVQQPLMVVMPERSTPRAELHVPTSAAGFLKIGQEVRLAVDAFPYQRFGTVRARITQISSVAIPQATADGGAVPVYLVTALLADPSVHAFGHKQPLLPGMALSARIVTQKQSLFEWLFEPLFAVKNR